MRPELLLHPNIPKPLHGMSPRELCGDAWWDSTRKLVYQNAGYRCQCCDTPKDECDYYKRLEAHETYDYDYANGIATVNDIVALCHACHSYIHSGLLQSLFVRKQISFEKYHHIMKRGDAIIASAGLKKPEPPATIAEWSSWRIVIQGVTYQTKWKNYEEWKAHYGR